MPAAAEQAQHTRRPLGQTDLVVSRLCLGTNTFGWTNTQDEAIAVLDAYVAAGGNFIDTADMYPQWAPGCQGGESETILGRWITVRGNRDELVIATKVAKKDGHRGLSPHNIRHALEESLQRLNLDTIDLYYAHEDDLETPQHETARAFDELVRQGKVRHVGASNFTASRLTQALELAHEEGLTGYSVLQQHYNAVHRRDYDHELQAVVAAHDLALIPYAALASGYLTGKYQSNGSLVTKPVADRASSPTGTSSSPRTEDALQYADSSGTQIFSLIQEIAQRDEVEPALVALAWLYAQPHIPSVLASARTPEQLAQFTPLMLGYSLQAGDVVRLNQLPTSF